MATGDRIRMECDKCGYKCVPQWLNDKAHCLKCQAVLRTRGSLHEAQREVFGAEANGETRRTAGEVSTFKLSPSSAMESVGGACAKSPNGQHHFKYGKCNFCQVAEGKLVKGPGVMANPGGAAECDMGGKCMFKFAKCTKCGRGEAGIQADVARRPSHDSGSRRPSSEVSTSATPAGTPPKSPVLRPQSPLGSAGAQLAGMPKEEEAARSPSKSDEVRKISKESDGPAAKGGEDRTRMTCHLCGYKSVPQWMNDKAHCLKCDAVVKTRNSIHGEVPVPENVQKDLGASRLPGEASTYKAAPGSAMESASGSCGKSPDGVHHWKYGKCNFCQQSEGKLMKGTGVVANPGGAGGCEKGGKCVFKFSKCNKCGRREY